MELDPTDVLVKGTYTASDKQDLSFRIYSKGEYKIRNSDPDSKVLEVDKIHTDFISNTCGKIYMQNNKIYLNLTDIQYDNFLAILNTDSQFNLICSGTMTDIIPGTWTGIINKVNWRAKLFNKSGKLDPHIGNDLLGGRRRKRTIKRKRRSTRRRSA